MDNHYHTADISDQQLSEVQALEQSIGKVVVAVEPTPYASLSDEALKELQAAEQKLGVVMLAYE